jgi:hypothetical protein
MGKRARKKLSKKEKKEKILYRELVRFLKMKFKEDKMKQFKIKKKEKAEKKKKEKKEEVSANDKILELERAISDSSLESDPDEPTGAAARPVFV